MSEQNNKSGLLVIAVVILVALIGAGVYFTKAGKVSEPLPPVTTEEAAVQPTTPTPEGPIVEGEVPPQPETPTNVVVETKKLDVPATETAEPAAPETAAAAPTDPSVAAMMADRSIGSPTAPIKVTEYSSLNCGHCAAFHKETLEKFKTEFVDTGKVQLTFKEFPLNPAALDASQILRCMPEDKFVSFMGLLFEQQENWAYKTEYKEALRQNAKLAGMSDADFDKCLANDKLKEAIVANMKAASDKYKIQSTPSFVVDDGKKTIVGNQPIEFFEKTFNELNTPTVADPAAGQ